MDRRHSCCYIEVLDEQVDYHSSVDVSSGISYYNFEHLENISDRSQTSAPDKPECSKQHDKQYMLKCRKSAVTVLYVYALFNNNLY